MTKRGQVAIFIIVGIFLVGVIVVIVALSQKETPQVIEQECVTASDCVPSECCAAEECVPLNQAPVCIVSGTAVDCQPGCKSYADNKTMCGQGSCGCVEGKCVNNPIS